MVIRSPDVENDHFSPRSTKEKILGHEVPYHSGFGALMYLANNTHLYIYICWLKSLIHHVQASYGLKSSMQRLIVIYEDKATCIGQIRKWYIKGDETIHI